MNNIIIDSPENAILGLLNNDNQIRYYAAWWLGKHQVQSALIPLCDALKDTQYRTEQGGYPLRRQAARALAELKNPNSVTALLAALECDDLRLKEAVINALAKIGDRSVIPALINLLESPESQPLEVLIEALGTLEVWEVKAQITQFLDHPSERVQCAVARYLFLCTKESQYIDRIIQNLNHENMYLRWAAAFDLGAIGHLEAAKAILNAPVGNSLKLLNLKRLLSTLLEGELQENKAENIKFLLNAIDNLLMDKMLIADQVSDIEINLDNMELINQLQKAVIPSEIIPIVQELTNRKIIDLMPILLQMLSHHHPAISTVAIEGLVKLAPYSVLPLIEYFKTCLDHGIQAFIIQALAQIGDIRALETLLNVVGVEVANHCQGSVRRVAALGLGNIGNNTNDISMINACIDKLKWALFNAEDWALRYASVVALENISREIAKPIFQAALITELDPIVKIRMNNYSGSTHSEDDKKPGF